MIRIEDVTKSYATGAGQTQVLKGITFSVQDGEFVAIMGPSGSGKSTLMNILGALDTATTGMYLLGGKNISGLTDEELAEIRKDMIGFVFQSFNLLPRATVLRNVMLPLVYTDVDRVTREKRASEALTAAGLDAKHWNQLASSLSGGQMQRVAIARALVNNPSIILADEPTGNLDTATGNLVLSSFQKLHEQGRTIILITHEPDVAEHAQRVITIRDGLIESDRKVNQRKAQV